MLVRLERKRGNRLNPLFMGLNDKKAILPFEYHQHDCSIGNQIAGQRKA